LQNIILVVLFAGSEFQSFWSLLAGVMSNMLPKHDGGLKFVADIATLAEFVLVGSLN
jgi:hypothetical protein